MIKKATPLPVFDDAHGLSRIAAISDGVFAIVMTLLILEIKIPEGGSNVSEELYNLLPTFVTYLVTFFLLGSYWIGHHSIFRHVHRYDRKLLWLNLIFLMLISTLPFPTILVTKHLTERLPIILYSALIFVSGLVLSSLWGHVSKDHYLIDQTLDNRAILLGNQRIMLAPKLAVAAIFACFISPYASLGLYVLAGLIYLRPSKIENVLVEKTSQ